MFSGIVKSIRPHQWVKNLFVLVPAVFAKELFDPTTGTRVFVGFAAFCLASSAVYLVNDLADIEADRAHPKKRFRPIASGQISPRTASIAAIILGLTALGASIFLGVRFSAAIGSYLLLNAAYGVKLKHVPYVDVTCISTGFFLRVLAGAYAAQVPASKYLLLVTFLLALFLALGKRMHELTSSAAAHKHRSVLKLYDKRPLTFFLFGTAAATVGIYIAYSIDPDTRAFFGTDSLVWTTAFALFGVGRFIFLVRNRPDSESPTEEMLRDPPLLLTAAIWGFIVMLIIYFH
jgi:decaprenyl-phosphate phosphoribosyltransferase